MPRHRNGASRGVRRGREPASRGPCEESPSERAGDRLLLPRPGVEEARRDLTPLRGRARGRRAVRERVWSRSLGPESPSAARTVASLEDEAAALYRETIERYGDLPTRRKPNLASVAEGELFDLRKLAVGQPAPEIVGTDLDGRMFKLSDYRGKVVVLTFSGSWCGPCVRMYPREAPLRRALQGDAVRPCVTPRTTPTKPLPGRSTRAKSPGAAGGTEEPTARFACAGG